MPKYALYILPAVLVAGAAFLLLRAGEEEKIMARLEQIRGLVEIQAQEGGLEQATRARQIGRLFAGRTVFDLTNAGHGIIEIDNRQELVRRIMAGRKSLATLELTLQEAVVSVDGDSASVRVRGSALGSSRNVAGQFLEIHLVDIQLEKQEDGWVVSGARHIRDERLE